MKWFNLNEIINQKPKFIALIEQNLKLDGEFVDYKFVYSSKHNFFKMITKEVDKKKSILNVSFLKKKVSLPEGISDQNILEHEFIESVLDHCKYSSVKNIRKPKLKKKMIFKKFGECKIKYLNTKDLDKLTLKNFIETEKKDKKKNVLKKIENKKETKDENNKIQEKIESEIVLAKSLRVAFSWQKLPYPVISNLEMNNKNNGILNIFIHETKDECFGTVALSSDKKGNWSLSCPDNKNRFGVFKKELGASGTILIENEILTGNGFDNYRNKVKFIAYLN